MSSQPPTSFPPASDSEQPRVGYVALAGRPNAGKSTLFNALLGQRLSIVTAKPQTTRGRILGILTRPQSQIIFLDTPGLLDADYKLHETMEHQIDQAARQADLVLLLVDASRPKDRGVLVRRFLDRTRVPVMAALNKIDLLEPGQLDARQKQFTTELGIPTPTPISALRGDGLDELLAQIEAQLPYGPKLYPDDMVAEQPERFFVAELIREAAFEDLEDELPYAINVDIEEFSERPGRKTYINAILYVERESQKGIVIGKKGKRLHAIGRRARAAVEELLAAPVYLELWVKIRPNWRNKERDLKEFGYL
ncbi:MAG: GTPase Era [Candidatus Latescibacterota bacterium]|nr:GTPase Era [Candidatus Latescibacterota bacterium]